MNHKQLLGYLPRDLVDPVVHDVARLTAWVMLGAKRSAPEALAAGVLAPLLLRWNCVLDAPGDEVSEHYKDLVRLTLAVVLHRHGFQDDGLTKAALQAIDRLNDKVVLSDTFYCHREAIKALVVSPPIALSRRPATGKNQTFWRAGDAASVQIGEWFYAIYVQSIVGNHEAPIVEIYDFASRQRPGPEDIRGCQAKGQRYNDGVERISLYAAYGLRDLPDRANQFQVIASGVPAPRVDHLQPAIGLYAVSDHFRLLKDIQAVFGHA
ncbi:hypothetical protein [Pseudomonas sp. LD120]|uniref:hypothetical protein n=1 Tax=Pseudomonas sp. LD120 TaxID=485751 RepID=UPI0013587152|nr:hypothetical protein [Pseudomonas sp. LD120]KAF0866450.1 hypothetical protein PLD_03935 [Pseudomonas sp. LD120]